MWPRTRFCGKRAPLKRVTESDYTGAERRFSMPGEPYPMIDFPRAGRSFALGIRGPPWGQLLSNCYL